MLHEKNDNIKQALGSVGSGHGDGKGNDDVITKYNFSFLLKFA